ncbi:hypothetical protein IQ274_30430 [Nostoc sp. LEGE 12447]|uniref:hypothetical protein n=1 Tax=Nostoc sp. LEGE 12447 TaxID=1828640 RepID=UPI0018842E03|nr:hypothetical protein [Nostoc sp. LEGE 12447]MBE9002401.1 hypothetical protein [Nostoc sp. LEGE 12447]
MAQTTDFTNFGNERPNYFAGQYLLEDDFEIQHKYLSDRQRYHNQSLHISGIIEGLEVIVVQNTKSVQIKSGSAINSNGDLIISKENITFSDFKNLTDAVLYIQYAQDKQVQQQKDVPDSYTRWIEKPILGFATTIPENSVKLGKLTIAQNTITLDANVREYSGLSLPNSNSKALTLRSGGNTNPNLAVLTGSLKIDGDLTVNSRGNSSFTGSLIVNGNVGIGTIEPGNYKLNVQGNQLLKGSLTIQEGKISLDGSQQIAFSDTGTTNQLKLQLWSGYGLGVNGSTLFYTANGNHSWRDNQNIERMLLSTAVDGGLTVKGTGNSSFGGNLTVSGTVQCSNGAVTNILAIGDTPMTGNVGGSRDWMTKGMKISWDSDNLFIGLKDEGTNRKDAIIAWGDDPEDDLRFITVQSGGTKEGNEVVRIKANGNFGIGTNNPGEYKLNVQGNQLIQGSLTVNGVITGSLKIAGTIYAGGNPVAYENYEIYLRGSAFESSEGNITFLKIANIDLGMTSSRGLNTVILNPNGTFKNKATHDVFGNPTIWNSWATWVNTTAAIGDVIAVASYDALNIAPTGGSAETLLRSINAGRVFQSIPGRYPYTLLFIQGQSRCIEVLQPNQGSNAHLKTTYYQLLSLQNITQQEPWQTPTFQNNWVNYDNTYNPAGYFKDSLGIVHLRGLVRSGTNNTTIFTLPVGYRPSNRELQAIQTFNNTIGRLDILTDGQVQVVLGNNGWVSLDGITFRAA